MKIFMLSGSAPCTTLVFEYGTTYFKVGHTDLVLACYQGSFVGLCMKDYKSLCAAVTICAALVNIQTHRQTSFYQFIWKAQLGWVRNNAARDRYKF